MTASGAAARVVCADHDPVVLAHLRALAIGTPTVAVTHVHGDVRNMKWVLSEPGLVDALDIAEPIAVSLHEVLPWITDDGQAAQEMAVLRDWLPSGSLLSVTHLTVDLQPKKIGALAEMYDAHGLPVQPRTRDEVADLLGTWRPLEPGIVPTGQWHGQHPHAGLPTAASAAYAVMAVKEPR